MKHGKKSILRLRREVLEWASSELKSGRDLGEDRIELVSEILRKLEDQWPSKGGVWITRFGDAFATPTCCLMDILYGLTVDIETADDDWALGCVGSSLFNAAHTLGWEQSADSILEDLSSRTKEEVLSAYSEEPEKVSE